MSQLKKRIQIGQRERLARYRPSFTLIELLVSIAIIGIMAGMVLFTMAGAQSEARMARTRGTIQKINEIVLQKWEEYRYKPVNVRLPQAASSPIPGSSPPRYPVTPRDSARLRMTILRDSMRMEMPDRITDLLYEPSLYTVAYRSNPTDPNIFAGEKIDRALPHGFGLIYEALRNQILALKAQGHPSWTNGFDLRPLPTGEVLTSNSILRFTTDTDANWSRAVQSGELLYLLVATSQFGGSSALEYFRPSEVGDPDGDGLLEFVDAWGESIAWIRWPAGYPGDLVRYADDDAMDPLKTDWRYRSGVAADWHPRTLVPLILSSGNDKEFGVTFDFGGGGSPPIAYATMTWPTGSAPNGADKGAYYSVGDYFYPDPFFTWDFQTGRANGPNREIPYPDDRANFPRGFRANQIGSIPAGAEALAADNVTNHDIILEP
jgi:prepilin-type N-terminal cleavage/methylation domain-containing protein